MQLAAMVLCGSFIIEGASLIVAIQAVKEGANAEGMKLRDYIWRGHDPTSVAVMTEVSSDSQQCCSLCCSKKCVRGERR
ncbi:metal tolerance protein C4-like [Trifolium medium]|uniref:Metal tolerance protein C4-like n=1 Tax=Trifolium medium TaxID=97028 RepID=A0A392Q7P7_9FABA|nr:metal tolerance protein C4-like [Trifolium medium]